MSYYENYQPQQLTQPKELKHTYYWVTGITEQGRTLLIGWFSNESEAYNKGYSTFSGDFDVHPLQTKDRAEAVSILKYRKMSNGLSADDAMQRFRHKEIM